MGQADTCNHLMFVYDATDQRVLYVNAAYETMMHGTCANVNEEYPALLALLHPDDREYLVQYWQNWTKGRTTNEVEVRYLEPNRPQQWLSLTPSFQTSDDGHALLGGTIRNISTPKHYQENADLFNSRKNATLEILSHDLSSSFILIQQIAEFLREEMAARTDSRVPDMLNVLETTSQNSVGMIRNLINLEFLTSVNTDLKCDRVDIGPILRTPLEQLQSGQRLLGHQFSYTLPTEAVYVSLDVNKFTQVVINLVSNALKFTPDDGHVEVVIEALPETVRILVTDNGVGIPLNLQPFLFERFTKARRLGLRGEATTGLGLALCKNIVEWHHGTISVVSTEGVGTTFTVELPRIEVLEAVIASPRAIATE